MLWWANSKILKISNFGRGRCLGPNDHLFRQWLKEKHCYSVRPSAMAMIYTSIEYENDCLEGEIVKTEKHKILGVVNQWDKTIIILDHIWHKKL